MYIEEKLHKLLIAFVFIISVCVVAMADSDKKSVNKSQAPVYTPPKRGAPVTRIGGGTRGGDIQMILRVLAPAHTGWTHKAQPVLYWYISRPTNIEREIILYDGISVEPLLEIHRGGPILAGVHALSLSDHHIQLQPNIDYEWSISLINEPQQPSKNIVASGTIAYVKTPLDFQTIESNTKPTKIASLFSSQGYWYDALESLLNSLEQHPNNVELKEYCSTLLNQVGLTEVECYKRLRQEKYQAPSNSASGIELSHQK